MLILVSFQLPSTLCSCQKVAYTIEIEDINTGQVEIQGPFYHNTMEHKLHITQDIVSAIFQRDNNYTMTVIMESLNFGEISTSNRYFFGKSCCFLLFCRCYSPCIQCLFLRSFLVILSADNLAVSQQSVRLEGVGNIYF